MAVDWKSLFSAMGVDWRDRGPNTTRHDVNICCPFCGDDYGYHLGVSLRSTAYFCFRNSEHGGRSAGWLLRHLGATSDEAESLLKEYSDGAEIPVTKSAARPDDITRDWRKFHPASGSDACMDYLRSRGFSEPVVTSQRYGLRYAPIGKWARRLILPVTLDGSVVSWTARAIDEDRRPKYLMQSVVFPGLVYMPRLSRDTMVIVEGPLDALKIAACGLDHVGAVALMGKALNSRKLLILTRLLADTRKVIFAPDADVDVIAAKRMQQLLALTRMGKPTIPTIKPPAPYKDAGAMPFNAIRPWVHAA